MPDPNSHDDGTNAAPQAASGPRPPYAAGPTEPATPLRIGRFEVRSLLGEGAFGRVFLAFDAELERQVAIKLPKPEGFTADMRERFIREARAMAKIRHPNVCPVYEVGTEGELPYFVMHYQAGTTLAGHLDRWKVLPPLHAVALAQKLALGVAAAHDEDVIHRDLKPQNVLFDPTRQLVLITDFGLTRIAGQSSATVAGSVFGTPLYMSPEQARGRVHEVGPLSDVYSLGIILYRMLTGNVPFRDESLMEVLRKHCEEAPVPPSVARRGLDPRLDRLCLKAIAKKPADRYQSARAFAAALGEYARSGDSSAWQKIDPDADRVPTDPLPAPVPPVPPIPPRPIDLTPTRRSTHKPPPGPRGEEETHSRSPAEPTELLSLDDEPPADGSVRQKVLIGGVAVLFLAMIVGVVIILANSQKTTPTEPTVANNGTDDTKKDDPKPGNGKKDDKKDDTKKDDGKKDDTKKDDGKKNDTKKDDTKKDDTKKEGTKTDPKPKELPSIANGFAGHTFDQAVERRVAEWVLSLGSELRVAPPGSAPSPAPPPGERLITRRTDLPAEFAVSRIEFVLKPNLTEAEIIKNLTGLTGPVEVSFQECRQVGDDTLRAVSRIPKLTGFMCFRATNVTDAGVEAFARHPELVEMDLQVTSVTKDGVRHLATLPKLRRVTLGIPETDLWLSDLKPCTELHRLTVLARGPQYLTDRGLVHLKPFSRLKRLTMVGPNVTDAWIPKLLDINTFPDLEELDLRESGIDGPGLAQLHRFPRFDWIDLSLSRVRDEGLTHLSTAPRLAYVFLNSTGTGDDGLRALAKCKNLEVLALRECKNITDKGVANLADCTKLRSLDLTNTGIGDEGAKALAECRALKRIVLIGTNVTPKGVQVLKDSLPDCDVVTAAKK